MRRLEMVRDGTVRDGTVQDGTVQDRTVRDGTVREMNNLFLAEFKRKKSLQKIL